MMEALECPQAWTGLKASTGGNSKTGLNRIEQENTTAKNSSSWVAARYVIGKYQGSLLCGISPKVQLDLPHSECSNGSNGTWQCKWQVVISIDIIEISVIFQVFSGHLRSLSVWRLWAKQHVSHCTTCRNCHSSKGCNSGSLSGEVV